MPDHHTRRVLLALTVFLVLALVHTWPLASAPSQLARIDNADAALNAWAVHWVGARLLDDPARAFDANIFYPEKLTLALVFSAWALLFATLARAREWLGRNGLARAGLLAVAVAVATLLMWPELRAYRALRTEMGLARGAGEQVAAGWLDYLATGARVHQWWVPAGAASSISYAFPGVTAIVLLVVALTDRATRSDPRVRMCAAAAVGCAAISMAPRLPFYPALHEAIPLFQAFRVLARINQVVLLLIAVLAGFGVAALGRRWPAARSAGVLTAVAILVNFEALRAPIGFTRFDGVPDVYRVLAKERRAVVVELPFPFPQQWFLNARYMLNSTAHWQPLLNGYSGFRPASYDRSYEAARMFPAQESLIALHDLGVTHVVVHRQALGEDRVARLAEVHELEEIGSEGDIAIYRLRSR